MSQSFLICTRNNADQLTETLDTLLAQEGYELLVGQVVIVDNGSSDHTKEVFDTYAAKSAKFEYVFEEKPGLQNAKNAGLPHCTGDLVVMTDDDCLIEAGYVRNLEKISRERTDIGLFGGKIIPVWGMEKPDWLGDSLMGSLALLDLGDEPLTINYATDENTDKLLYGANYAIRRELFEKHGHFHPEFTFSQDVELTTRMYKAGEKGLYHPSLIIHHQIPPSRMDAGYFYRWAFRRGHFRDRFEGRSVERKWFHFGGYSPWLLRQMLKAWWTALFMPMCEDKVRAKMNFHTLRGIADERSKS